MYRGALAYIGLTAVLGVSKVFPQLGILAYLYMLTPLLFLSDERLGFKNYRKGFLMGSVLAPALLVFPPDLSCPAWVLNQLGIASAEEIFFRGFLMMYFGNFLTSMLFALSHLIHYPTLNSVLVFFPSLLFGFLYTKSGSIVAPILAHFTANLLYFSLTKEFPQLYHLLQRQLTGS